jgi:sulfatase modifying factor 1
MKRTGGYALGLCLGLFGGLGCHDFGKIKFGQPNDGASSDGASDGASQGDAGDAGDASMPGPLPPSCAANPICPPSGDSCCASALVPQVKAFSRGWDTSGRATDVIGFQMRGQAPAYVSSFILDKYEVTVARFRPFLKIYEGWLHDRPFEGDGAHPRIPGSGWIKAWINDPTKYPLTEQDLRGRIAACNGTADKKLLTWIDNPSADNDTKPMTCVGFYEALLFCIWDLGRLPTETEWNVAAAGGEAQYAYPWGTPPDSNFVVEASRANVGPFRSGLGTVDVGSLSGGDGVWGHHDLAGNAYEWVHDLCSGTCDSYDTAMVTDPLELPAGGNRILRGGSYLWGPVNGRTAYRKRVADSVVTRYEDVGWRCARNAP